MEFLDEGGVEAVPVRWLTNDEKECFWPQFKTKNSTKTTLAIKAAIQPTKEFSKFPVRVYKKYLEYDTARKNLDKATYASDLQTEAEDETHASQKRTKKPNRKFLQSDDSSEESSETEMPVVQKRQSPRKKARSVPDLPELPKLPSSPIASKNTPSTSASQVLSPQSTTLFETFKSPKAVSTSVMERKLLATVEEVKVQVHFNTKLLQTIVKKLDNISSANLEEMEEDVGGLDVTFPLTSKTELMQADEALQGDENRKKLARSLSTIGGENMKSSVRRLLTHMITNNLAQEINWMGKGEKVAFSKLNLLTVLKAAVRKNRLCASATDAEIASVAKDWFRFAKDRKGGRKKREERKKRKEAAPATATSDPGSE